MCVVCVVCIVCVVFYLSALIKHLLDKRYLQEELSINMRITNMYRARGMAGIGDE